MHRLLLDSADLSVPPAAYGNKTRDAYINEANFDTNMVIILAALLCALIGALGLNSIVRCALRCSRRFSADTPEQEAARTGLKKRDLKQIPVAVCGTGVNLSGNECPICLVEFADGEKVRVLPKCNHGFHVRCIDTWLQSHSSCPNCRLSLLEHKVGSAPAPSPALAQGAAETNPSQENDRDGGGNVVVFVQGTN